MKPAPYQLRKEHVVIFQFLVVGRGAFPLDMLRYDSAWPASSDDVSGMDLDRDQRSIRLYSISAPTVARWASFGWEVKP